MVSQLFTLEEFQERVESQCSPQYSADDWESIDGLACRTPTEFSSAITIHDDVVIKDNKERFTLIAFLLVLGFIGGVLQVFCQWAIYEIQALQIASMGLEVPIESYALWTLCSLFFVIAAVVWTILSPAAAGSGIAQMKVVLTGIDHTLYLPGYFSLWTLLCKIGGLISANGAGLYVGTEGVFVHIMAVVAHNLLQLRVFRKCQEHLFVRLQLLGASSAVAVSSAFGSPIGGVLFSIEVTATYYLVSNYFKAFVSSVTATWMVLCTTRIFGRKILLDEIVLDSEAPINLLTELPLALILGVLMGALSWSILFATKYFAKLRKSCNTAPSTCMSVFMRWIDPAIMGLITATCTYFGTKYEVLYSLPALLSDPPVGSLWTLAINALLPVMLLPLSVTLKFPTGVWLPNFVGGAACGRFYALLIHQIWPQANINDAQFALIGAGCLTGAATRTVSAAVIALEIVGNLQCARSMLCAVILSIGVSTLSGLPSIYDVLGEASGLPYLPVLAFDSKQTASDILHRDVVYLSKSTTMIKILLALNRLPNHEIPVVNNDKEKKLLGVVSVEELKLIVERFYKNHNLDNFEHDWGDKLSSSPKTNLVSPFSFQKTVPTLDHIYATLRRGRSLSVNACGQDLFPIHPLFMMDDVKMSSLLSQGWSTRKQVLLQESIELPLDCIQPLTVTLSKATALEDVHVLFTMLRLDHIYVTEFDKLDIGNMSLMAKVRRCAGVLLDAQFVSFSTRNGPKNGSSRWQERTVQIDRSGLLQPNIAQALLKDNKTMQAINAKKKKSKENELVRSLRSMIEVRGPITVAEFMRHALSDPLHGYYMKRDVFGKKGDFTTAPEISQMFGELIGIWCIATWQQLGMPSAINIVEMGPGRGSLMQDFIRTAKQFPPFYNALNIQMVEISPALRKIQLEKLDVIVGESGKEGKLPDNGPTIAWYEDVSDLPTGTPSLYIAQELFDALPVHQFEYTSKGWCERLIDIDVSDSEDHFCFVLSPGPTAATRVYIGREKVFNPSSNVIKHLSSDNSTTPHDILKNINAAAVLQQSQLQENTLPNEPKAPASPILSPNVAVGDRIEISPTGIAIIQDVSRRIAQDGGAALIVDYGRDHPSEVSLRGIQNHEFVSVLREPGDVDLSIDVDFSTLRRYATESGEVKAFGPIEQGLFLKEMGIEHRMAALFQNCSEETQEEIYKAYERLVHPDQMGTIFKAMALISTKVPGVPVAFGGDHN
ncbi:hypothetical protein THRCLA_00559 [Thraustotheca clavata]|uniref:Chloride channel protein n=1 Tax=Thraustotheca clavata TaxID=74557 RepID=A0A1W0AAU6_9STRA|nr:hypothetical protein THRCLA_00559 [Thraustotheca clavata]